MGHHKEWVQHIETAHISRLQNAKLYDEPTRNAEGMVIGFTGGTKYPLAP